MLSHFFERNEKYRVDTFFRAPAFFSSLHRAHSPLAHGHMGGESRKRCAPRARLSKIQSLFAGSDSGLAEDSDAQAVDDRLSLATFKIRCSERSLALHSMHESAFRFAGELRALF